MDQRHVGCEAVDQIHHCLIRHVWVLKSEPEAQRVHVPVQSACMRVCAFGALVHVRPRAHVM